MTAGLLRLDGCRVHDNVAESLQGSLASGGGALYVSLGIASILGSSLLGNRMGGLGLGQADASKSAGGAHVLGEGGDVVIDSCSVSEGSESGEDAHMENGAEWWLVVAQSLALRNSSFRSTTSGQGLLQIQGPQLQLMIRGCTFENLRIGVVPTVKAQPIGIVNSTFTPALDPSVPTVQPTGGSDTCAAQLAGERLCDARAKCERSVTGVVCSCVGGSGLRHKPGVPEDGRLCEQDSSLRAVLESESVAIDVQKPGILTNRTLTLIVEAHGEAVFDVVFDVTMTLIEASGLVIPSNESIRVDRPSMSAFGLHIEWKKLPPPAATWEPYLDGSRLKYADTMRLEFTVELKCHRGNQSCAADGDVVSTVVQLTSLQDGRLKSKAVTVQTHVIALASCNHSVAVVMQSGGSLESATAVTHSLLSNAAFVFVELRVVDADDIPIRVRTPNSVVLWGKGKGPPDQIVLTKPAEGGSRSNRLMAGIDSSLRRAPGLYRLQVVLRDAWTEVLGAVDECVLLEQIVRVDEPEKLNTVWLSVGSLLACAVFVGAIVFWTRRMSAELKDVLAMVLTEASKTIISISFSLGNLATDLLTTYRVVFEDIVKSENYRVPYAVFGCLAIILGFVSIVYQVRRACQLRFQIKSNAVVEQEPALSDIDLSADASHAVVRKLQWELKKCSRELMMLAVGMLTLLLEDLPMVRVIDRPGAHSVPVGSELV